MVHYNFDQSQHWYGEAWMNEEERSVSLDQSQHWYGEAWMNEEERSVSQAIGVNSPDWMDTLKSMRDEI